MGILFAVGALLCWGVGDFLIQKSARCFGVWILTFYITAVATVLLFPFVVQDLAPLFVRLDIVSGLFLTGVFWLFAGLLDFQALKVGKMSVVEPVFAFEIGVSAFLAAIFLGENLSVLQYSLAGLIVLGIFLVTLKRDKRKKILRAQQGVWCAVAATTVIGIMSFLIGLMSRVTSPLVVVWCISIIVMPVSLGYIMRHKLMAVMIVNIRKCLPLIAGVTLLDNLGWIFYSYATLWIPIAMASALSEGYIVIATVLGMVINKERFTRHQWVGFIITIVSATLLAYITDK